MSANPLVISSQPLNPTVKAMKRLTGPPPEPINVSDWLKDCTERYGKEDLDFDWRIYARAMTIEKFFQGEHFGRVSRLDGTFRIRPRQEGDPRYVHNWIRGHALAILAQWTKSRTEFDVTPLPEDDATDIDQGVVRVVTAILSHYQRILLTEEFKQRESLNGMFTGQMFRYSFWNPNLGGTVKRPQWEMETHQGPGTFLCTDCGMEGVNDGSNPDSGLGGGSPGSPASVVGAAPPQSASSRTGQGAGNVGGQPAPASAGNLSEQPNSNGTGSGQNVYGQQSCPACGSSAVVTNPGQSVDLPRISGYDEYPAGDLDCWGVPGTELKWDRMTPQFRKALWLRWRRQVRPEVVKEIIPNWKRGGYPGGDNEDWGMRVQQMLRRSSGNIEASGARVYGQPGNRTDAELVTVDCWWLMPTIYAAVGPLKVDLELASGDVIPAGTSLSDVFPDGLAVMMIDHEPVDLRNECLHDHWQHTPTVMLPSRSDGDGLLDDLIEPQKEVNDICGLILSNIKNVDGAGLAYRSEYIDGNGLSGKPYERIPLKPGTPPEMPIANIVAPIPRPGLPTEVFGYLQQKQEEMQWQAKSFSTSVGAPDVQASGGAGTATGATLMAQGASAQRAPELALRAAGDVECAQQWLKLVKQNMTAPQYFPLYGKSGEQDGRFFQAADLNTAVAISVKPGSYTPRGEMERRQDFMGLLGAFGGIQGLIMAVQTMPNAVETAMERFNANFDVGGVDAADQLARRRIEAMKQALPQAQAQGAATGMPEMAVMSLVSGPETSVDPDDPHQQMIRFYTLWKVNDEGADARVQTPLLYQAVTAQIQNHKAAMVQSSQEQSQMQIASQAPMMAMQQQMQAQQTAQQQQAQADDQEQQAGLSAQQQANAVALSQQDHAQAMAQLTAKQQGDQRMEELRQQGQKAQGANGRP